MDIRSKPKDACSIEDRISSEYELRLARKLGRDLDTVQIWNKNYKKKHNSDETSSDVPELFSAFSNITIGKKRRIVGCGLQCGGEHNLLCPSCKKFAWHRECLVKLCGENGLPLPDFTSPNWCCPHCC